MSAKKWQIQSFYEWLVSALFFWVFIACVETARAIIFKGFPRPLGSSALPSVIDIRYFIAALSIYALLSIPTALALFGAEKAFSWLKGRIKAPFLDLSRMDLYLLLAWGLLCFKWISNLMPYIMSTDHLPNTPYLFILPLLGLQIWLGGFFRKTTGYYRTQWVIIAAGAIFLSKTAYDVFIGSSFSIFAGIFLFVLFAVAVLFIALTFHSLLNRIILNRFKPRLTYVLLFAVFLSGGCLFTLNAFETDSHSISSLVPSIKSQKGECEITKNVIIILVDC